MGGGDEQARASGGASGGAEGGDDNGSGAGDGRGDGSPRVAAGFDFPPPGAPERRMRIWGDGGCNPNPGTGRPWHRSGVGAHAAVEPEGGFASPDEAPDEYDGETAAELHCWAGHNSTNNTAEWWAMLVMLHGAGCAMGDGQFGGGGPGTFLIIGDSLNVINQMKGAFGAPGDARLHQLYRVARGRLFDQKTLI